jgi:hypothetical protein
VRWKELDEDTQRQWDEKAKSLHSAKKDAKDCSATSALMTPADAQKYVLLDIGCAGSNSYGKQGFRQTPELLGPVIQIVGRQWGCISVS